MPIKKTFYDKFLKMTEELEKEIDKQEAIEIKSRTSVDDIASDYLSNLRYFRDEMHDLTDESEGLI